MKRFHLGILLLAGALALPGPSTVPKKGRVGPTNKLRSAGFASACPSDGRSSKWSASSLLKAASASWRHGRPKVIPCIISPPRVVACFSYSVRGKRTISNFRFVLIYSDGGEFSPTSAPPALLSDVFGEYLANGSDEFPGIGAIRTPFPAWVVTKSAWVTLDYPCRCAAYSSHVHPQGYSQV